MCQLVIDGLGQLTDIKAGLLLCDEMLILITSAYKLGCFQHKIHTKYIQENRDIYCVKYYCREY